MTLRHSIRRISAGLLDLVPPEVLEDLRTEDPASAVEVHFSPIGLHQLPVARDTAGDGSVDDCSVDGYYDPITDPRQPWIFYSADVVPARMRFTVIHELGHHLFATDGAHFLDDLDRLASSATGAARNEEAACQQFAGEVLVPRETLDAVVGGNMLVPRHIPQLRESTGASWEAVAVGAANHVVGTAAVALITRPGEVSFVAVNGLSPWPRGSSVAPGGPLDRALRYNSRARPETYRYGLAYAENLFCDTERVDEGLAIAILSPRTSDGHFEILHQPEPAWREREEFCEWCGNERNVGWCDRCAGQKCHSCDGCGCTTPLKNPPCPACFCHSPFRSGANICMDCEANLPD